MPQLKFDESLLNLKLKGVNLAAEAATAVVEHSLDPMNTKRRTVQQVQWLCELYAGTEHPNQGSRQMFGIEEGKTVVFQPGKFLDRIRGNWLGGQPGTTITRLTEASMRRIAQLPWFAKWESSMKKRHGRKQKTRQKVAFLCALWPGKEAPVQKHKKQVPAALTGGIAELFDGGKFLFHVKANWLDSKPNTKLDKDDMRRLEFLPWFRIKLQAWGAAPKFSGIARRLAKADSGARRPAVSAPQAPAAEA